MVWVELPAGTDGTAVYRRAYHEDIRVAPGRLFATGRTYDRYLRLSAGVPWSGELEHAIARLGALVAES